MTSKGFSLARRPRLAELRSAQDGFTLLELLVAVLIISLLAMASMATLIGQRAKGGDAAAKELMHTALQTANTYVLENGYGAMTPAALKQAESTINTTANGNAVLVNANPQGTSGFLLTVVSSSADTFNLTNSNGTITRTCVVASGNGNTQTNTGGGCHNGAW